jgi:hypothetical protein
VHAERVVAGGAVDDAAELVEAPLSASAFAALVVFAPADFGCGPFEGVVVDERFVAAVGFDPV